ncbi:uncharacterized protein PGTG_18249 [Puccinia graminis f. sp. tritici CRL 75-36-700-3]|uniref:BED-type domain-containing protein n=1 Tax=Puccinia graminis f. sp. tritici (strain CRL 75-36-700-3 / race SCCL) TaxID=418459 RepID=E3L799_PUCGT|nr:uncharacterized protein PGTG_18249 [Puccinia graminis f. sp. tritici CRL 75-36-700-3]EFP92424.1 hypothetical protein PGTG_18249 [Puccinia graminis f. sp. tritici CRL 75-36-700-3]
MAHSTPRHSPTRSRTPSVPPSRRSTRIVTPLRTNARYVRTNSDCRKSLSQDPRSSSDSESSISGIPKPSRSNANPRQHQKKKNQSNEQTNTNRTQSAMDLTQDSDNENFKVTKKRKKCARKDSEFGLDEIELYFHEPFYEEGETKEGPPMHYKCKWCGIPYKKGDGSRGNLVKHRDGAANRSACNQRAKAIRSGAKLPLTAKEIASKKRSEESGTANFIHSGKFDPKILNQLIVLWIVQSSLPWSRIEDKLLRLAFRYARPGLKLNSRVWAASEAHSLYCNLQEKVVSMLQTPI